MLIDSDLHLQENLLLGKMFFWKRNLGSLTKFGGKWDILDALTPVFCEKVIIYVSMDKLSLLQSFCKEFVLISWLNVCEWINKNEQTKTKKCQFLMFETPWKCSKLISGTFNNEIGSLIELTIHTQKTGSIGEIFPFSSKTVSSDFN